MLVRLVYLGPYFKTSMNLPMSLGSEVKSLMGMGIFLQIYSHMTSILYFNCAEIGMTGASIAFVPTNENIEHHKTKCIYHCIFDMANLTFYNVTMLQSFLHIQQSFQRPIFGSREAMLISQCPGPSLDLATPNMILTSGIIEGQSFSSLEKKRKISLIRDLRN